MSMMLAIVVYQHTKLEFHRPSHSEDMAYYYYYYYYRMLIAICCQPVDGKPHLLHVSAVDRRQIWSMDKS